jgi:hypothetical protein
MQKIIGLLFIFTSLFPWVGFSNFDSQPAPIFFALIFIIITKCEVPKYIINIFYIIVITIIFLMILELNIDFIFIRGLANYFGIPVMLLAFHRYIQVYELPLKLMFFINIIYLTFGIYQIFSNGIALDFVAQRTTFGRGVPSLTPEPTFFAIYLFYLNWIYYFIYRQNNNKLIIIIIIINILAIIFLAQSSMVLLFLIIGFSLVLLSKFSIKLALISISILSASYVLINNFDIENSRILTFVHFLITNPLSYFTFDASANQRLSHIILPIHAAFDNFMIPSGFHSFLSDVQISGQKYNDFFYFDYVGDKIMSWIGSLIYEFGVSGILIIYILYVKMRNNNELQLYEVTLFFIVLLSAIPLAFPLVYMLFVLLSDKNLKK